MLKFEVKPFDVLFLGSGRPFHVGDTAVSIFPPLPHTLAGAICSKIYHERKINPSRVLKRIYGPFLHFSSGKEKLIYFPKPFDICRGRKKEEKIQEVYLLRPFERNTRVFKPENTNKPEEIDNLAVYYGSEEVEPFKGFVSQGGLKDWLEGRKINKDDIKTPQEIFKEEKRVGIRQDVSVHTVVQEDGLYRIDFVRLKENWSLVFWVNFNYGDKNMEKILYIDCFSGISGDMMVGALLDLGIDIPFLKSELKKLNITGYSVTCSEVKKGSIKAKKFNVKVTAPQPARNYGDIKRLIGESKLDTEIKKMSLSIFKVVAEAEAAVHGYDVNNVHFHEIGAVDSIIDIVCTAICLSNLKVGSFYCSSVPMGSGFVNGSHGKLPVPAPATVEILKKIPVYGGNFNFEVTTPTGAAIIKTLVSSFGNIPYMEIEKIGYGAGNNKGKEIPNILRLLKGIIKNELDIMEENLIVLSANIDDSTPEILGYLMEELFKNNALDVWIEPIYMKKNRPAFKINVLCRVELEQEIINLILLESTTLGVRRAEVKRYSVSSEIKTVRLPYGEVKVKVGNLKGREINISPEFESCKKLAKETGKPLKQIYHDAILFFSRR